MNRIAALVAALATLVLALPAGAQGTFPTRPVRILTPYPTGSLDQYTRWVAERLAAKWGQPVVVDAKAGGSGIPLMIEGKDAAPDGHTLTIIASGPAAGNVALYSKLPYDPVRDYAMIGGFMIIPLGFLVSGQTPYTTLAEVIAAAKKAPGTIEYASPGLGTSNHLTMELFKTVVGVDLLHVPYKGPAPALTDLVSGRVKVMVLSLTPAKPMIQAGKLRVVAVTDTTRFPAFPDVPTIAESGYPGFSGIGWGGLGAPAGTPPAVLDKIGTDLRLLLADPALRKGMIESGLVPDPRDGRQFRDFVRDEIDKWAKVAKAANVKLD